MCLCSRDERTPERLAEQSPMEGISIEGTNDPTTGDVQEIAGGGRATVTRMGRDLRPEAGGARSRGQCRAIGRGPGRHGPGRPRKSVRLNSCSGNVSWLRFFGQHVPGRNPSLFDPKRTKNPTLTRCVARGLCAVLHHLSLRPSGCRRSEPKFRQDRGLRVL